MEMSPGDWWPIDMFVVTAIVDITPSLSLSLSLITLFVDILTLLGAKEGD